jgi:GR25 family glycosyltransferase involved in LPS biosynthesis
MNSVEKEFDDVVFSERFSANRAKLLWNLAKAFLASWMSTLKNAEVAIDCVVFFEADVAFLPPILFNFSKIC